MLECWSMEAWKCLLKDLWLWTFSWLMEWFCEAKWMKITVLTKRTRYHTFMVSMTRMDREYCLNVCRCYKFRVGFGRLASAHARADSFQKRRAAPYFTKWFYFFAYISFIIDCLSNIIRSTWVALNLVIHKDASHCNGKDTGNPSRVWKWKGHNKIWRRCPYQPRE